MRSQRTTRVVYLCQVQVFYRFTQEETLHSIIDAAVSALNIRKCAVRSLSLAMLLDRLENLPCPFAITEQIRINTHVSCCYSWELMPFKRATLTLALSSAG